MKNQYYLPLATEERPEGGRRICRQIDSFPSKSELDMVEQYEFLRELTLEPLQLTFPSSLSRSSSSILSGNQLSWDLLNLRSTFPISCLFVISPRFYWPVPPKISLGCHATLNRTKSKYVLKVTTPCLSSTRPIH